MKNKSNAQVQTKTEIKLLKDFDGKKSPYIRYLAAQGLDRKAIVAEINKQLPEGKTIRYQHVRNVLITPLVGKKA